MGASERVNQITVNIKTDPNIIPAISKPFPLLLYSPLLILFKSMLPHTIAAITDPNTAKNNIVIITSSIWTFFNKISKISHKRSI